MKSSNIYMASQQSSKSNADKPHNAHDGIDTSNNTKFSFSALRTLRGHHVHTTFIHSFHSKHDDSMIVMQFIPSK
jgi:hypothetical protein